LTVERLVETADAGHADVEHQASRVRRELEGEELRRARERLGVVPVA